MKSNEGSALLYDCGKGKTSTTLKAIDELFCELEIKGVLIVSTLRVSRLVWPLECQKFDDFNWLKVNFLHGPKKAERLRQKANIYTINYEGLIWLCKELSTIKPKDWPFDMIVFDELTKMKNSRSVRFKKIKKHLKHFKKRVGLTGTIQPKDLMDLFGQIYVLDLGERLGSFVTHYRDRYFEQADFQGYKWKPYEWAKEAIYKKIADIVQIELDDGSGRPLPEVIDIELNLPGPIRKQYKKLEKEMFVKLDKEEVEVFNAAALTNKCLQFSGGAVYMDEIDEENEVINKKIIPVHDVKIEALKKIREDHPDKPLLIGYGYQHERDRIKEAFPNAEVLTSGLSDAQEIELQRRWDNGEISELICHPASAGHGLNFQYGGHILIWFTLNWSLELYIQFNKRIDRQGQKEKAIIYRLMMLETVDEVVLTTLNQRDSDQNALLNALKLYRDSKK